MSLGAAQGRAPRMESYPPIRRVVTGHDAGNIAKVLIDAPATNRSDLDGARMIARISLMPARRGAPEMTARLQHVPHASRSLLGKRSNDDVVLLVSPHRLCYRGMAARMRPISGRCTENAAGRRRADLDRADAHVPGGLARSHPSGSSGPASPSVPAESLL
jgi:hypothetical protein